MAVGHVLGEDALIRGTYSVAGDYVLAEDALSRSSNSVAEAPEPVR